MGVLPPNIQKETFDGYASQIAFGRATESNDIAKAILFLTDNEYMTSKIIGCDGGLV